MSVGPVVGSKVTIDEGFEYEVTNILEGGMGRILFLRKLSSADAFDFFHRSELAAKTFKDGQFSERCRAILERELNVWLSLDCQNIATLLRVSHVNHALFAIMPLYQCSVRQMLDRLGRFSPSYAAHVLQDVLAGLDFAYRKFGIVHHDLKPDNILLDKRLLGEERYVVADWGMAGIQSSYCPEVPRREWLPASFVNTMSHCGTLPYMSPERLLGSPSDVAGDIYSIGMLFFEFLFGHLPYSNVSNADIEEQILDGECFRTAAQHLPRIRSDHVSSIILKCLNPNPASRYPDHRKLAADIRRLTQRRWWTFWK